MDELKNDKFTIASSEDLPSLGNWLRDRPYDETEVLRDIGRDVRTVLLLLEGARVGVIVVPGQVLTGSVAFGRLTEMLFINRTGRRSVHG